MRFFDLLIMSINNLRRRKLRTGLTVLGVVIGTASIVVMVSLGIGLKENTVESYASFGSLTRIQISSGYGNQSEDDYLVDATVTKLAKIPHVKSVSPILETDVNLKQGVYQGYSNIVGMPREELEQIPLAEGKLPDKNAATLEFIVGNMVSDNFYNSKTGKGSWDGEDLSKVDLIHKPFFTMFQNMGNGDENSQKKYLFPACALVDGGENGFSEYGYQIYTDIDLLKTQLKKIYRKNPIPGQPTNKKGKPYNYFVYNMVYVNVDDMEHVTEVQKAITDMGYEAYSSMQWLEQAQQQTDMIQAVLGGIGAVSLFVAAKGYQVNSQMDWLESSRRQSNMVQAVLGGIGAVSLFVAAIGIANTMMMSIYERTKEIGVLKVLGCALGDIRTMFLMEAGFIGFMGGVLGLGLSYSVSAAINKFLGASLSGMTGGSGAISRIPLWLSGSAVVFAVLIGMLAGLFPALRAMKLSPLAAIRNE